MTLQGIHRGPYICKICRRGLEHEIKLVGGQPVGETFTHNAAYKADHAPDPTVDLGFADQVSVCDFCGDENPTWEFECPSFEQVLPPRDGATRSYGSVEGWFSCGPCHHYIQEGDLDAMWVRWLENHAEDIKDDSPADRRRYKSYVVDGMWERFMQNKGSSRPILTGEMPQEP